MNAPGAGGRIAIVGGVRTPFAKVATVLKNYSARELAVHAVNALLERTELPVEQVDELIFGNVIVDPRMPHLAREVVFASRLPASVRALTIVDNCITGTSALAVVMADIQTERARASAASYPFSS